MGLYQISISLLVGGLLDRGVTSEVQRIFTNIFWESKNLCFTFSVVSEMYHEAFIINVLLLLLHFSNIISQ